MIACFNFVSMAQLYNEGDILTDVGEMGWVQSPKDESRQSIHMITAQEYPAYIALNGVANSSTCYLKSDKINELRKYLERVIRISEEWTEIARENNVEEKSQNIPGEGPKVMFRVPGKHFTGNDREQEKWSKLKATWQYFKGKDGLKGCYIELTARYEDKKDPSLNREFKMWLTLDGYKLIVNKIINKKQADLWVNTYMNEWRKTHQLMNGEQISTPNLKHGYNLSR